MLVWVTNTYMLVNHTVLCLFVWILPSYKAPLLAYANFHAPGKGAPTADDLVAIGTIFANVEAIRSLTEEILEKVRVHNCNPTAVRIRRKHNHESGSNKGRTSEVVVLSVSS